MVSRKRKRAPGGGRKPQGPVTGKRATLTMRITSALRSYLDREAKAAARSLSQEAELRLQATMGRRIVVQLPVVELMAPDTTSEHEQEEEVRNS